MRKIWRRSPQENYCHQKLNIVPQGETFENCLFMKKENLVHETIFLNVVDYVLYHVTHVETTKDAWDNLCATFEWRHVGKKWHLHHKFYNLKIEENALV